MWVMGGILCIYGGIEFWVRGCEVCLLVWMKGGGFGMGGDVYINWVRYRSIEVVFLVKGIVFCFC